MDDESTAPPRLDGIETQWSLVRQAHEGTAGLDARRALVLRYAPAIRAYVGALTRNDQDADEISQDAVVRLLNGDFAGADPDRGRFRDLLKVAVRNMVRNHWDRQNRRRTVDLDMQLLAEDEGPPELDTWITHWRDNVMEIAWSSLQAYEQTHAGSRAYTILKMRADFPTATSEDLAVRLSQQLGQTVRPDALRQQLRRARARFAKLLVAEIAAGLTDPEPSRVQEELICLGIYEFIKDVL